MSGTDNRESQQRGLVPFKSGQSGNPKGRPKGSRNKINEAFLQDFYEAWLAFGRPALMAAAWEKPADFVKVGASLLPKEVNLNLEPLNEVTDADLDERIRQRLADAGIQAGAPAAFSRETAPADPSPTAH